jgi:hypothetical protein
MKVNLTVECPARDRPVTASTRSLGRAEPITEDSSLNCLLRLPRVAPVVSCASPPAPYQEPVVQVSVSGVRLVLPELALHEGLSDIRLATEAHVCLADYSKGVALVLLALARRGMLSGPCFTASSPFRKSSHSKVLEK